MVIFIVQAEVKNRIILKERLEKKRKIIKMMQKNLLEEKDQEVCSVVKVVLKVVLDINYYN